MKKVLVLVGVVVLVTTVWAAQKGNGQKESPLCALQTEVFTNFDDYACSQNIECGTCDGDKTVSCSKGKWITCEACKNNPSGAGTQKNYRNGEWVIEKCGYCKGSKQTWDPCKTCGGGGKKICSSCCGTGVAGGCR